MRFRLRLGGGLGVHVDEVLGKGNVRNNLYVRDINCLICHIIDL